MCIPVLLTNKVVQQAIDVLSNTFGNVWNIQSIQLAMLQHFLVEQHSEQEQFVVVGYHECVCSLVLIAGAGGQGAFIQEPMLRC